MGPGGQSTGSGSGNNIGSSTSQSCESGCFIHVCVFYPACIWYEANAIHDQYEKRGLEDQNFYYGSSQHTGSGLDNANGHRNSQSGLSVYIIIIIRSVCKTLHFV